MIPVVSTKNPAPFVPPVLAVTEPVKDGPPPLPLEIKHDPVNAPENTKSSSFAPTGVAVVMVMPEVP
jgi:hypothetical protein